MKEHPMLFKAEMVNAILDGSKTQTRRIVKNQPIYMDGQNTVIASGNIKMGLSLFIQIHCPYAVGDQLWIRETFKAIAVDTNKYADFEYADCEDYDILAKNLGWRVVPSIHMPRELSRVDLKISNIRLERLNDISEEDAKAEGCKAQHLHENMWSTAYSEFYSLWMSINGEKSWDSNPWIWVYEFGKLDTANEAAA